MLFTGCKEAGEEIVKTQDGNSEERYFNGRGGNNAKKRNMR